MQRLVFRIFTLSLGVIALFLAPSCKTLTFTEPVPQAANEVSYLPDFFEGTYIREKGDGAELFEIHRLNDQTCQISLSLGLTKDSLDVFISEADGEGVSIKIEEKLHIIYNEETSETTEIRKINGYYFIPAEVNYEINLAENYFQTDELGSIEKFEVKVREANDIFFLNKFVEDVWFLIAIEKTPEGITIHRSEIENSSLLQEGGKYANLNGLMQDGGSKDWIASPTDEQLFQILRYQDLFEMEEWESLSEPKKID
ncbi:MAG: hypothetical protein AAF388_13665, partial [Bacteroidota bacterium]